LPNSLCGTVSRRVINWRTNCLVWFVALINPCQMGSLADQTCLVGKASLGITAASEGNPGCLHGAAWAQTECHDKAPRGTKEEPDTSAAPTGRSSRWATSPRAFLGGSWWRFSFGRSPQPFLGGNSVPATQVRWAAASRTRRPGVFSTVVAVPAWRPGRRNRQRRPGALWLSWRECRPGRWPGRPDRYLNRDTERDCPRAFRCLGRCVAWH
jgi:hypothetical protein